MPNTSASFTFAGHETNYKNGEITFSFELQTGNRLYSFKEKILLSTKIEERSASSLRPILDTLLLALGVSYWKTYCPKHIVIKPFGLQKQQADFWNEVYTKGLGEFYYKNGIDFRGLVQFPYTENAANTVPMRGSRTDRSLVLLGGGKDSIVTAQLLKEHGKQFALFALNPVPLQDRTAGILGARYITVTRTIDPQLFALNGVQGIYNGHVPISSIYACMGLLVAALYDYRYVIASNEASANYGNVEYLGQVVNHQWSKSIEFERFFQSYVERHVTPDIKYFSLLRPIHEVEIVKLFTKYSQFFPIFSSCNRNFRLSGDPQRSLWCGKCPKCAFVFLSLAAFLPKAQVMRIFGMNVLADGSLLEVYRELLGVKGFKPFECVGTPEESIWAFSQVIARGEYANDVIASTLQPEVRKRSKSIRKEAVLGTSTDHAIPNQFQDFVHSL